MNIQVGDLVLYKSAASKVDRHGIVLEETPSSVFEGGEKIQILMVLMCDSSRPIEVMSWSVRKVNA